MNKLANSLFTLALLIGMNSLSISVMGQGVDDPVVLDQRIFVLQNYVDNFNFGLNAGGELSGFGNVLGEFSLQDNQGAGKSFHPVTNVDAAAQLATVETGFSTDPGGDFIGFSKTFATSTDEGTGTSTNTIDASSFNAISYFVKNFGDNSDSSATVAVELVIGDGGDTTPADPNDVFTGSTWSQTTPKPLNSIVTGANNDYERVVVALEGSTEGAPGGFRRTVGPTDGNSQTTLTPDLLQQIAGVNITVNSGGESGIPRTILIDDINFFDNFNLELRQDRVFTKATGTGTVTVTAILTRGNAAAPDVEICFIVNQDTANPVCLTSDINGAAFFTYNITSETEIVTIDVTRM